MMMPPVGWFLLFGVLLVLVGWTVSKVTGSRAFFLETWAFEPGETVRWKDEKADVFRIPERAPPTR
jgi:hypothetical protein